MMIIQFKTGLIILLTVVLVTVGFLFIQLEKPLEIIINQLSQKQSAILIKGITIPFFSKPIKEMTREELIVKITEIIDTIQKLRDLLSKLLLIQTIPQNYSFTKDLISGQT